MLNLRRMVTVYRYHHTMGFMFPMKMMMIKDFLFGHQTNEWRIMLLIYFCILSNRLIIDIVRVFHVNEYMNRTEEIDRKS